MGLAIFDLDNTLLAGDSDYLWGQFLVDRNIVKKDLYEEANAKFYEDYKNGTLDIQEYLEFALKPLAQNDTSTLVMLHHEFMEECILPIILPKAKDLIEKHREAGDELLVITATNRFITGPIVKHLGIDNILATEPEMIAGQYTGKYVGTPTFQDGKVKAYHEWLDQQDHTFDETYFYSDSINDLPLLEMVDHPIAVDADEKLTAAAAVKGWKSISLR